MQLKSFRNKVFQTSYGCKSFFSAIKENSVALSLLALVGLSILTRDIFPQTCYLSQVGNFIPPKSTCPSFFFYHFVLGTVTVLRQIPTIICIPLARNKPGLQHLPPHDCWSCFSSLPATFEFILSLCTFCLCLKCIFDPLSLFPPQPHTLHPFQIRHPWASRGVVKEQ